MESHPMKKLGFVLFFLLLGMRVVDGQAIAPHTHGSQNDVFGAMMDTMMSRMDNVSKRDGVDFLFIHQMIPHHQAAVDMAVYEVQHGNDFGMIQLAKSILTEQTSELQQMKLWLRQMPANRTAPVAEFEQEMGKAMNRMMSNMPDRRKPADIDHAFVRMMRPHHQAAVDMAKAVLGFTESPHIRAFAKQLISAQQIEIEQIDRYLK